MLAFKNTAHWKACGLRAIKWSCNRLIELLLVLRRSGFAREPLIIVLRGGNSGGKPWFWPAELTTSVQLLELYSAQLARPSCAFQPFAGNAFSDKIKTSS